MGIITILFWVSIITGGLLILLLLLSILSGLELEVDIDTGGSSEVEGDAGGFGVVKGLLTFISVGAWVMRILLAANKAPIFAIAMGIFTGVIALLILHYLLKFLLKNEENVNWSIKDALFQNGKVYLKIPKHGEGIVQIDIHGAQRELKARTNNEEEIPTGDLVLVIEVINDYVVVEKRE